LHGSLSEIPAQASILAKDLSDPTLQGHAVLQRIFFAPTETRSQAAGAAFIEKLAHRKQDREPAPGPEVAQAQIKAFREWTVSPESSLTI
jgi:hypothetical protein